MTAELWIPPTEIVEAGPDNTYRWATVTQVNPTRIRLDGDTAALPFTPETIHPYATSVGDRVWVQIFGRRVLIVGRSQGLGGRASWMAHEREVMSGGGVRKVSATGVSWSQRFILIGSGKNRLAPDGHFNITMPTDGTVIPVHNSSPGDSVTVASGTVPMINWQALYYELPVGGTNPSVNGNFHIVYYSVTYGDFEVPNHWILIAVRNGDTRACAYKWGDGRAQDYWRALTLQNSWVTYGSGWNAAAYKLTNDGQVRLRGLIKSGTVGSNIACLTMSSDLAPEGGSADVGMIFYQHASGGGARVDVHSNGEVCVMQLLGGATSAFVSLDNMSWFPSGA